MAVAGQNGAHSLAMLLGISLTTDIYHRKVAAALSYIHGPNMDGTMLTGVTSIYC